MLLNIEPLILPIQFETIHQIQQYYTLICTKITVLLLTSLIFIKDIYLRAYVTI